MKRILLFTYVILIPLFIQAQLTPELSTSLHVELEEAVNFNEIEGISAAVVFPNGDVWESAYGLAGGTDSLTTDHYLLGGSTTKTFIAAAIMQLQEEGKLMIGDSLGKYIGPYTNVSPHVTLYQLLTHTSGIYNYTNSQDFWTRIQNQPSNNLTVDEIMSYVGVSGQPGMSFSYSNTNYILLSLILEAVEEKELQQILRERFINRLGYDTMFLGGKEVSSGPYGGMYTIDNVGNTEDISYFPTEALLTGAWGAGAIATTPEDLARWVKDLYGSDQVVSDASYNAMITGSALEPAYGLGTVNAALNGCDMLGHSGGIIHSTEMRYFVDADFSVVIITNGGVYDFEAFENISSLVKIALGYSSNEDVVLDHKIGLSPNPFTSSLALNLDIDHSSEVKLSMYDLMGKRLAFANGIPAEEGFNVIQLDHYFDLSRLEIGSYYLNI